MNTSWMHRLPIHHVATHRQQAGALAQQNTELHDRRNIPVFQGVAQLAITVGHPALQILQT